MRDMKAEIANGDRLSLFRDKQQINAAKEEKKDLSNMWYLKGEVGEVELSAFQLPGLPIDPKTVEY